VRLAVGGGFAFSLGVAKELWDLSGHGDASWRDLTWDAVGRPRASPWQAPSIGQSHA